VNRLEGKFGSTKELFSVTKFDLHLTEPVSMLGVVANIRSLDFVMDLEMVAPETFVPRNLEVLWISDDFLPTCASELKNSFPVTTGLRTSTASAAGNK